jgi:hypothetical protein
MFYIIFLQTCVKLRTDKTFKLRTDNKHSTAKSNLQGNLQSVREFIIQLLRW